MIPTNTDVSIRVESHPSKADATVVLVHKEKKSGVRIRGAVPEELGAIVEALADARVVTGKSNEVTVHLIESGNPGRLIVIGLGNPEKFSAQCLREAGGAILRTARKQKIGALSIIFPDTPATLPGLPDSDVHSEGVGASAEALVTGLLLAAFDYGEYKGSASKKKEDEKQKSLAVTLLVPAAQMKLVRSHAERAVVIADGQNFARTIASRPGNNIIPQTLALVAEDMAKSVGLGCQIMDDKQLRKLGMGGILAVGDGSIEAPPRLIVLQHRATQIKANPKGQKLKAAQRPILIVGKAITFDTGGISIKPAEKMGKMIYDKCGGMTVLGLMYAIAKLKLPVPVVGILSAAENHISSRAYRPGDILKMYNGVTVEVTNTDAEGRLVLGDALAWGIEQFNPISVVDLATLTGGVIVALGKTMAGVMSNDDALVDALHQAGQSQGELMWRLPVGDDQRDQIKSDHADIVNSAGREAHPLQGGAFLSHFVKWDGEEKIPWAHLDIAGVADTERELPFYSKGATGWGVRTLFEWISQR